MRVNMRDSRVSFHFIVSLLNIGLPDPVIKWVYLLSNTSTRRWRVWAFAILLSRACLNVDCKFEGEGSVFFSQEDLRRGLYSRKGNTVSYPALVTARYVVAHNSQELCWY